MDQSDIKEGHAVDGNIIEEPLMAEEESSRAAG
jgi:hypothetical protein